MSTPASSAWTTHGHPIPGVAVLGTRPAAVARCGGTRLCQKCKQEAGQAVAARELNTVKIRAWPSGITVRIRETPTTEE